MLFRSVDADSETTEPEEPVESAADDTEEDIDLGTLADLESFQTNGGSVFLTEDQELLDADTAVILTEDDLPSPAELDSEKDFSENN